MEARAYLKRPAGKETHAPKFRRTTMATVTCLFWFENKAFGKTVTGKPAFSKMMTVNRSFFKS